MTDTSPEATIDDQALRSVDFEDWPDSDLDIDDEAFAAAIARGRGDDEGA